ncbi:hypothetical protein A1OS_22755 [Enterovibrio norvegicus]|uniref:hypothetical protein n=1 Tax=Enterovibrio norvegicus TaxID=188144 RepID=UPI000304908F|nr:hypothetical protein [Enterovibrio norvegicus]OEE51393.1 hypothetical protein A1OS_22755 [Enterovibrio norvegicus]
MNDLLNIKSLIEGIWKEPTCSELTSKKMDVSTYSKLGEKIPDKFIEIEEVFPKDELEGIWSNYEGYLSEYKVFPFLGTLGEAVICIGYDDSNKGKVYYFDFDFGIFELDGDELEEFIRKLITS